jgi:Rrf2 family protein
MQLTRAADYAVRVMIHLSSLTPGTRLPLHTLAQAVNVPESFLSKVLQSLTRAGLIASRRGTDGGFTLHAGTNAVSMLDVIQAIDGPIQLNVCLAPDASCSRSGNCPAHPVWARAQEALVSVLAEAKLSDMGARAHSVSLTAMN